MPSFVQLPRTRGLALAVLAVASLIAAVPAAASAACPPRPLSTPFSQFGDDAAYTLVPGGSFESGAAGWSLTNAQVTSGNESYAVQGGSHSLAIQPDGTAVSPAFCVSPAEPTVRFFVRQASGSRAPLNVILRWTDANGATRQSALGSIHADSDWQPTPSLQLGSALPVWPTGEALNAQLVFVARGQAGAWAIDDVYLDPQGRG
jgi:hypothetical protein